MLPPNEFLTIETQRIHRQELMREADKQRLAQFAASSRPSRLDCGLAYVGRHLTRLGRRLEARVPTVYTGRSLDAV